MPDLLVLLGQALAGLLLRLAVIIALAWLLGRAIGIAGRRIERRLVARSSDPAHNARLRTLLTTAVHTAQAVVAVIAGLMLLLVFGIDIAPLLAGVGVAGLAVS